MTSIVVFLHHDDIKIKKRLRANAHTSKLGLLFRLLLISVAFSFDIMLLLCADLYGMHDVVVNFRSARLVNTTG